MINIIITINKISLFLEN